MEAPIDLFARKCSKMGDEELHSEIRMHLVALGHQVLTPESKHRTMILLEEGLKRDSMSSNHNDFSITVRILKHL